MKKQNKAKHGKYYASNIKIDNKEQDDRKKSREREKRIRENKVKQEQDNKFDIEMETVIGMTNRNNKKVSEENKIKLSKKQKQIIKRKKRIKRIIKWTSLIIIITAGIVFALVSPIFNINNIEVVNNNQISSKTIISLSGLSVGDNIFKFTSSKIKENIKTNAYIENINVKRLFPNKIQLIIKEREKSFNVEFLNGYAYINKQGYIMQISENKEEGLPIIQGISTQAEDIIEGNRLNSEDLGKLETAIQILKICKDYSLDTKVTIIDITNRNDYLIYMEQEKKTIYIGNENNLSNKMLYVQAIMEKNQDKEGSIYVNGDINSNFKPRFREKIIVE